MTRALLVVVCFGDNKYGGEFKRKEQLAAQNIKKDKDVEELYLAKKCLGEVCSLQQFKHLKYLWLNGNRLRRINCLQGNFRLVELYLQNNQLVEITGALAHLTCLKVLMLNNNQLFHLDTAIKEMKKMNCLHTLNLFDNPLAQEPDYRLYVINALKSVCLLDRQEVLDSERTHACKVFQQDRNPVEQSIAFGRRSEGLPHLFQASNKFKKGPTKFDKGCIGNSFLRDQVAFDSIEEAINDRRSKKTVTMYTGMDWSKMPRMEERRRLETPFDTPEIVTHVYR